jgi:ATP-dependent Lon protease
MAGNTVILLSDKCSNCKCGMLSVVSVLMLLQYGLPIHGELLSRTDLHIHFSAGAVRADGPSAGITIATALISLFSERPVESDVAITGEITLGGVILRVREVPHNLVLSN